MTLGDDLRLLAAAIAREAGDMVDAGRRGTQLRTTSKSSPTDMVTQFDTASEALIVRRLTEARPHDGLIGEEGSATAGTSGISWLVDPIDGTTNFLYDLPGWAVSIAAADAEGTLAGAVYVPARNEMFSAVRGGGAWLDDQPISCSATTELAHALVATGFGYAPERRTFQARRVAGMIGQVRDIRRLGAASVDLCHVACGRVDAYFEEGLGPWDLAAGELIAREAGCRSGDFHGAVVRPAEALVAPPALFEQLAALVREASPAGSLPGASAGLPIP